MHASLVGLVAALVTSGVAGFPECRAQALRAEVVDEFVGQVMKRLPIPGLAVAVVQDGEAVLVRGYGRRDVEAGLPVTPRTAFYIASSTKSYTGLATALLADRGRLDLAAPVGRYLPEMQLPAPRTADRVTVQQLLTHTNGLNHDGVVFRTAFSGEHDSELLIRLLARAETRDTTFRYDNLGYVVASLVLERVGGAPWQDVLAREVFQPLGLTRTTAYVTLAEREGWEVAAPYTTDTTGLARRPMKVDATMHAAGGLLTSATDAARWLEVQLQEGVVDGRRAFPANVIAETHEAHATLDATFDAFHRVAYGYGWYRALYDGDTLIHHFGSYTGFRSHISFMPEHDVGVAVLMNSGSRDVFFAPDLIARYVYDLVRRRTGVTERFATELEEMAGRTSELRDAIRRDRERRAARPARPPHPLSAYVGTYRNPDYGTVRIDVEDGRLVARIGVIESALEVYQDDDLRVEPVPGSGTVMGFDIAAGGRAEFFVLRGSRFERVR